jgi:hypothetical protein
MLCLVLPKRMTRGNIAILINSTPKYYDVLKLQIIMIRRYAPQISWPIFVATEVPTAPLIQELVRDYGIQVLTLEEKESGFLESRLGSLEKIPGDFQFLLPLQEDFLLDRSPDFSKLDEALTLLEDHPEISSIRLMPCPGPSPDSLEWNTPPWKILGTNDFYLFTYQATIWRRKPLLLFFQELLNEVQKKYPNAVSPQQKKQIALDLNVAESDFGQSILRRLSNEQYHLAWPRSGSWPNAVYLSPWPYRPTAVVKGIKMPFAEELFAREGIRPSTM